MNVPRQPICGLPRPGSPDAQKAGVITFTLESVIISCHVLALYLRFRSRFYCRLSSKLLKDARWIESFVIHETVDELLMRG